MRLAPRAGVVARLAGPLISALARSWRIRTVHDEAWRALVDAGQPYIILSWHDALLPLIWQHRGHGITMVVSDSREGRYLAAYAQGLGFRAARGSSHRGGVRALRSVFRALESGGPAAFTPDGPRGPRRVFKGTVLETAARTGAAIVAIHAGADRAWRLRSWDRMLIPKPFARVRVAYGRPFRVGSGPEAMEAARRRALEELESVVREVQWDDAATPTG